MKSLVTLLMLVGTLPAWASTECAGINADGNLVKVSVSTSDTRADVIEGQVDIFIGANVNTYRFLPADIPQYYEFDDFSRDGAVVGLVAYVNDENPVAVNYVGRNYVDQDLELVLANWDTEYSDGVFLRVWKGPGYAATEQYQISNIVCSVW